VLTEIIKLERCSVLPENSISWLVSVQASQIIRDCRVAIDVSVRLPLKVTILQPQGGFLRG
jgi:hypothetical protein